MKPDFSKIPYNLEDHVNHESIAHKPGITPEQIEILPVYSDKVSTQLPLKGFTAGIPPYLR